MWQQIGSGAWGKMSRDDEVCSLMTRRCMIPQWKRETPEGFKVSLFPSPLSLVQTTANGPAHFYLLSRTFFIWCRLMLWKSVVLAGHFPDQRLLMTLLPPHLSKSFYILDKVFLHLSYLNLTALKSPPHPSQGPAQICHSLLIFFCFDVQLFLKSKCSHLSYLSRPRLNFSCSRKQPILINSQECSLFLWTPSELEDDAGSQHLLSIYTHHTVS
jgi:hypothetical protein